MVIRSSSSGQRSRITVQEILLLAFLFFVVAPLRGIPLLGLNLSAVVFLAIILLLLRSRVLWIPQAARYWVIFLGMFLVGNALSAFVNAFLGFSEQVTVWRMAHTLAAYSYWAAIFVVLAILLARADSSRKILGTLALAVSFLSLVVLAEYSLGLTSGPGGRGLLTNLSQNELGIQFSGFSIAAFGMVLISSGWRAILASTGAGLVIGAVAINASRSSWIAILAGLSVMFMMQSGIRIRVRVLMILVGSGAIIGAAYSFTPDGVFEKFERRLESFSNLEYDKSYQARQVLVKKAWQLFRDNPIVGVGPRMFYHHSVDVELPRILVGSADRLDRISAHNAYMLALAEGGLVVAFPLALFLGGLAIAGWKSGWRRRARGDIFAAVYFGMFTAVSIHLWTISALGTSGPWVVYGLLGSAVLRDRLRRRSSTGNIIGAGLGDDSVHAEAGRPVRWDSRARVEGNKWTIGRSRQRSAPRLGVPRP